MLVDSVWAKQQQDMERQHNDKNKNGDDTAHHRGEASDVEDDENKETTVAPRDWAVGYYTHMFVSSCKHKTMKEDTKITQAVMHTRERVWRDKDPQCSWEDDLKLAFSVLHLLLMKEKTFESMAEEVDLSVIEKVVLPNEYREFMASTVSRKTNN